MCFGGGGSKSKKTPVNTSFESNLYGDWQRTKNTAFREGGPPTDQYGHLLPVGGDLGSPTPAASPAVPITQ